MLGSVVWGTAFGQYGQRYRAASERRRKVVAGYRDLPAGAFFSLHVAPDLPFAVDDWRRQHVRWSFYRTRIGDDRRLGKGGVRWCWVGDNAMLLDDSAG